ncbi:MAG: hypothetical protein COW32_08755 [Candidatus Aquicultor secundus]|uniref:Uncharacterized protein n=1 Tax=Candidatus Aquicultor secundus TaxID=1973895 RepID=A0A2M7TA86_9ACTN|nr:hypothetical protein [Candidatus Aquicultor secundus]NCO66488.1 hypothetical protein [Solirubrobacter sp.]OIO85860.1 MAG: hypothetical protein AUK32_06575 [Candidatus Aquicultor secundus]PIU26079.1 MAG: hypothetical protein COT10_10545 [Candidatus Aquicultor secundus]PIW21656.1 MAG: hypothetical protein COW32_08755 [Candidatus Aquicultor secundus]PIX52545.1 MAG: hypothetical protein COZ51_03570 [Candidatus Aquicultor secundus]
MRESDFGRVHIKSIIDRHLLDAGYDPYQGEMAKLVDAVSRAVQEILREYTRSVSPGLIKPTQPGEGGSTEA